MIGQPTERYADQRIEERERGAERAECRIAETPLAPNLFADRSENLAVEEVHQVDGEEYRERVTGAAHGG